MKATCSLVLPQKKQHSKQSPLRAATEGEPMWIVDTAKAVKSTFGDVIDNLDGLIDSAVGDFDGVGAADEAELYKELLVDTQFKHLKVSREYQKLFDEKEKEISRLKEQLGTSAGDGGADAQGSTAEGGGEKEPRSPKHVPTPMSSVWASKLREIITEKNVAEANQLKVERK